MKLDKYEEVVLAAFESGALIPVASKEEIESIRESARARAGARGQVLHCTNDGP